MNSNELANHIRELNKQEQAEHEQRREAALKRIRELREQQKLKEAQIEH